MGATCLANESESVVHALDYYPYGDQRISTGATTTNRQYIGERYDSDTDLNYLNARYYQSTRGQFLSEDPVFLTLGNDSMIQNMTAKKQLYLLADPQLLNSYGYGRNNPLTNKDPKGLIPFPSTAEIIYRLLDTGSNFQLLNSTNNYFNPSPGTSPASQSNNSSQFYFDSGLFVVGVAVGSLTPTGATLECRRIGAFCL